MNVENIHAARLRALSDKFEEAMDGAVDVCMVTVKADGSIAYLLGDDIRQAAALVGALEIAKADIISR